MCSVGISFIFIEIPYILLAPTQALLVLREGNEIFTQPTLQSLRNSPM